MYEIRRGKLNDFDPRVGGKRPNYRLKKPRGDAARASIGLSRLERGLLALDRLIRRMANPRRDYH